MIYTWACLAVTKQLISRLTSTSNTIRSIHTYLATFVCWFAIVCDYMLEKYLSFKRCILEGKSLPTIIIFWCVFWALYFRILNNVRSHYQIKVYQEMTLYVQLLSQYSSNNSLRRNKSILKEVTEKVGRIICHILDNLVEVTWSTKTQHPFYQNEVIRSIILPSERYFILLNLKEIWPPPLIAHPSV